MITLPELLRAIPETTSADGVRLQELEAEAVASVERLTDRYFGPPQLVEQFIIGNGSGRLWLRDHVAVDPDYVELLVSVDESSEVGGTTVALSQDIDYVLRQTDREAFIVRSGGDVWTRDYEYGVTYYRGYLEGEEPKDIRGLVTDLIALKWSQRGRLDLKSETIGGYSYTRFDGSDIEAVNGQKIIEVWTRPVVA